MINSRKIFLCVSCRRIPYIYFQGGKENNVILNCDCGKVTKYPFFRFLDALPNRVTLLEMLVKAKEFTFGLEAKRKILMDAAKDIPDAANEISTNKANAVYNISTKCEEDGRNPIKFYCLTCKRHLCKRCKDNNHANLSANVVEHQIVEFDTLLTKKNYDYIVMDFEISTKKIVKRFPDLKNMMLNILNKEIEGVKNSKDILAGIIQSKIIEEIKKRKENVIAACNSSVFLNTGLLLFFATLLDMYISTQPVNNYIVIKNLINNSKFDFFEPKLDNLSAIKSSQSLINFFDTYYVIKPFSLTSQLSSQLPIKNILSNDLQSNNDDKYNQKIQKDVPLEQNPGKIEELQIKKIKTIKENKAGITCAILLKDGRIVTSSEEGRIVVLEKDSKGQFEYSFSIKEHKRSVLWIAQLDNGNIISCSEDNTIKIFSITNANVSRFDRIFKTQYHVIKVITEKSVKKIINLTLSRFCSSYKEQYIKIFNGKQPYEYLFQLANCPSKFENCIQLKDERILSSHVDKILRFWDLDKKRIEREMKEVRNSYPGAMKQIDNKRVLVGEETRISIINIENYVIEAYSNYPSNIICLEIVGNNFIATNGKELVMLDQRLRNPKRKDSLQKTNTTFVLAINDHTIVTCSAGRSIRIWNI